MPPVQGLVEIFSKCSYSCADVVIWAHLYWHFPPHWVLIWSPLLFQQRYVNTCMKQEIEQIEKVEKLYDDFAHFQSTLDKLFKEAGSELILFHKYFIQYKQNLNHSHRKNIKQFSYGWNFSSVSDLRESLIFGYEKAEKIKAVLKRLHPVRSVRNILLGP